LRKEKEAAAYIGMELYEQNTTNVMASKAQSRKWKFVVAGSISSRV